MIRKTFTQSQKFCICSSCLLCDNQIQDAVKVVRNSYSNFNLLQSAMRIFNQNLHKNELQLSFNRLELKPS
jgi:hypothetical protein